MAPPARLLHPAIQTCVMPCAAHGAGRPLRWHAIDRYMCFTGWPVRNGQARWCWALRWPRGWVCQCAGVVFGQHNRGSRGWRVRWHAAGEWCRHAVNKRGGLGESKRIAESCPGRRVKKSSFQKCHTIASNGKRAAAGGITHTEVAQAKPSGSKACCCLPEAHNCGSTTTQGRGGESQGAEPQPAAVMLLGPLVSRWPGSWLRLLPPPSGF